MVYHQGPGPGRTLLGPIAELPHIAPAVTNPGAGRQTEDDIFFFTGLKKIDET